MTTVIVEPSNRCSRARSTTSRSRWRWRWPRSPRACRRSSRPVWRSARAAWPRRTRSCAVCRPSRRSAARRSSAPTRPARSPPTRCPSAGCVLGRDKYADGPARRAASRAPRSAQAWTLSVINWPRFPFYQLLNKLITSSAPTKPVRLPIRLQGLCHQSFHRYLLLFAVVYKTTILSTVDRVWVKAGCRAHIITWRGQTSKVLRMRCRRYRLWGRLLFSKRHSQLW